MSFDPAPLLATLKPFQRATVDYVLNRFDQGAQRFLVADEVGLGKTRVAQGVISVLLSRLRQGERADILYVCSNGAIARQNLRILNVLKETEVLPTRLTLLFDPGSGAQGDRPRLRKAGVNFIALTPGTSFDKTGGLSVARERVLVHHLLRGKVHATRLKSLLRGAVRTKESWQNRLGDVPRFDPNQRETIAAALMAGDMEAQIRDADLKRPEERNPIVKTLLQRLATLSLDALQPKLIIFDEFQKFRDLFAEADSEAQLLMQRFLQAGGEKTKVLFLSATPYRMLTIKGDDPDQGDHQQDFLAAIRMLHGGGEQGGVAASELKSEMRRFREHLRRHAQDLPSQAADARDQVQNRLRRVMSRQERVGADSTDAGLRREDMAAGILPEDLHQAQAVDRVARAVRGRNSADYWKSAPYLFSFMPTEFDLARKIADHPGRAQLEKEASPAVLPEKMIRSFRPVPPGTGRMRALLEDLFQSGDLHRRLWLPASLPYLSNQPALTKSLVFSDWQMVPEAIAALASYEAERRMRQEHRIKGPAGKKEPELLRLSGAVKQLNGSMLVMQLVYPSDFLARVVDPLEIWRGNGPLTAPQMLARAKDLIASALAERVLPPSEGEAPWELLAWLDTPHEGEPTPCPTPKDWIRKIRLGLASGSRDDSSAPALLDHFAKGRNAAASLPVSDRVVTFLARVALGSPAVCLLRALRRHAPQPSSDLAWVSANVALSFLTLFRHRETRPLFLRHGRGAVWSEVLDHCAAQDLQAVLDEHVFQLTGGTLPPEPEPAKVPHEDLVKRLNDAVGLRTAQITVRNPFTDKVFHIPSHLAARFAANTARTGDGGQSRLDTLLEAFNSPFRPFVLASTSVGQEGLDFHRYCHRIWHWNLPGSPADLEQREGRIQRHLNHAVRRNIAASQSAAARTAEGPAWPAMLAAAESEVEGQGASRLGLSPHWLYSGDLKDPAVIESMMLLPPFSREAGHAPWLRKTTALYRLAFGQPRQADLLAILEISEIRDASSLMIQLAPGQFSAPADAETPLNRGTEHHDAP